MKTKALIRNNITLNTNPEGCRNNIKAQIKELENLATINEKPLNVLIIGGSSGYGLASKLVLLQKANAYITSISFEKGPSGKRLGSPGYYNNLEYENFVKSENLAAFEVNGDAFSLEIKDEIIEHFKKLDKKIDLVVYSVASGIRIDPYTKEKYVSSLKPIKNSYSGLNIDIAKDRLYEETLEPASNEEIENTVKVMGGEDYLLWAKKLKAADILNEGVKFVTYTYIGSSITDPIYRDGTIGEAKSDLEETNTEIQKIIAPLSGKAYISASKAVVTKASVFIPTMALYASALFKVMKENKTHESIIEHKYRMFKDYIFNEDFMESLIRLDEYEVDDKIQNEVKSILEKVNEDNFKELVDYASFKKEYLKLSGF